jgi:hypothetical protein
MKSTKIVIIATIITAIIMISTAFAMPASAEVGDRGEFYPRLAVVTSYERIGDTGLWVITCTDKDGEEWAFYGEEEDAHIGNVFNLLMWNMGEAEEEDEIVEVYYEGRMDDHALMAWLSGDWQ